MGRVYSTIYLTARENERSHANAPPGYIHGTKNFSFEERRKPIECSVASVQCRTNLSENKYSLPLMDTVFTILTRGKVGLDAVLCVPFPRSSQFYRCPMSLVSYCLILPHTANPSTWNFGGTYTDVKLKYKNCKFRRKH